MTECDIHRALAPHLALMRREVRGTWPSLDPEMALLHWLCERNRLKPPQGSTLQAKRTPREARYRSIAESRLAPTPKPPLDVFVQQPPPLPVTAESWHQQTRLVSSRAKEDSDASSASPTRARPPSSLTPRSLHTSNCSSLNCSSLTGLRSLDGMQGCVERAALDSENQQDRLKHSSERAVGETGSMREAFRAKLISRVTLLKSCNLSEEELSMVLGRLRTSSFNAGEAIVVEGDVSEYLFIVEQGVCDVLKVPAPGEPPCLLHEIGREDAFGELALIYAIPRPVTVRAKTSVAMLSLKRDDLFSAIKPDQVERLRTAARLRIMRSLPLVADLSVAQQTFLVHHFQCNMCPVGTVFLRQGDHVVGDSRQTFVIEAGSCSMRVKANSWECSAFRYIAAEEERHTCHEDHEELLQPGHHFGMLSMFFGCPCQCTVVARTAVTTLSLSHNTFMSLCAEEGEGLGMYESAQRSMRVHLLRRIPQLSRLGDDTIGLLVGHAHQVAYKRWDVLFGKGDVVDAVYVLENGSLTESFGGTEGPFVEHCQGGVHFGVQLLTSRSVVWPSTLAASSDSVVLCIAGDVLRVVLQECPARHAAAFTLPHLRSAVEREALLA